jgi:hypothetical protein
MPIDPKIEAPLRKMLGHAMRGELDDLYALILAAGEQVSEAATVLAIKASGYISVQVSERWPLEPDIKALSRHAADTPNTQVTADEIAAYLSRVVLGNESPLTVFPGDKKAGIIPLFSTANLLVSYCAQHRDQWDYLDSIWNALDAAETIDKSLPPAVVYLYGKSHQK